MHTQHNTEIEAQKDTWHKKEPTTSQNIKQEPLSACTVQQAEMQITDSDQKK